jgi:hypothetical protein
MAFINHHSTITLMAKKGILGYLTFLGKNKKPLKMLILYEKQRFKGSLF